MAKYNKLSLVAQTLAQSGKTPKKNSWLPNSNTKKLVDQNVLLRNQCSLYMSLNYVQVQGKHMAEWFLEWNVEANKPEYASQF